MSLLQDPLFPTALAAFAFLLLIWLALRNRSKKSIRKSKPRGPGNLRYTCTKCSGQFLHSNRTISAWEKGTQRIFCDSCHKQWIAKQPKSDRISSNLSAQRSKTPISRNRQPSGCLGILVLLIIIPVALGFAYQLT
jgi:DNA-directed RNA polymerase subunit RPC12/RpoP